MEFFFLTGRAQKDSIFGCITSQISYTLRANVRVETTNVNLNSFNVA